MGMYTELILGCTLKEETPKICIEALDCVINNKSLDNHPKKDEIERFIEHYDLQYLFCSSSYYFGACHPTRFFNFNRIRNKWIIITRSNLKNYRNQIENFLDYISDYVDCGSGYDNDIYAYVQYEESPFPTIYGLTGTWDLSKIIKQEND